MGMIRPEKPKSSSCRRACQPKLSGRGLAPTTATDRPRSSASRSGTGSGPGQRAKTTPPDRPGDDQPLHLARAFPDPVHAEVAREPLDRILAHVAASPENLDTAIRDPVDHLGRIELCHRRSTM